MIIQFFLPDGKAIVFHDVERSRYRGLWLPGSKVRESSTESAIITTQIIERPFFIISHYIFQVFSKIRLSTSEHPGLRFEALLFGELSASSDGNKIRLRAGEYHLTYMPLFTALFKKNTSCSIFITHYSKVLLDRLGIEVLPSTPEKMSDAMATLVHEMLYNPYGEKLRDFYYENSVRELLFFHLSKGKKTLPSELGEKDIAAVYQADAIIASRLQEHNTIEELSRMTGTNQFKLKKGFRLVFGMGVFHRLLYRRMEHAKILLETTDKSIGEVATNTGYDTAASFIHAFRRQFNMTPREWRNKSRGDSKREGWK